MVRTEPIGRDDTLWLAALLAFPVIGFEQVLHTSSAALRAAPAYEALHWLSDALLALPLAAASVWLGHRLARRLGHRSTSLPDTLAHGLAIALVFTLLLVPGAALHEEADRLTHAHAQLSIHSHTSSQLRPTPVPDAVVAFVGHALQDAVEGQAVGLPFVIVALLASARVSGHHPRAGGSARPGAPSTFGLFGGSK